MFAVLLSLSAGAQERLVVQGIGELVGDEYAPRYVVLPEKFYNSEEWLELDAKIDQYISAHAFDDEPDEDDPLFDWDGYIKNMEEAIANFEREGNTEMANTYRESLEEAKKYKEEHKKTEAIENGVRDMLRLTILDNYERCKTAGVISVARKDAVDSAYNSYHALGGNGTVTQIHKEIMEMPIIK